MNTLRYLLKVAGSGFQAQPVMGSNSRITKNLDSGTQQFTQQWTGVGGKPQAPKPTATPSYNDMNTHYENQTARWNGYTPAQKQQYLSALKATWQLPEDQRSAAWAQNLQNAR